MEDACLDSDALIDAYETGIAKFNGLHTTCISLYEFLRGLAYLKKDASDYKTHVESYVEVLGLDNDAIGVASKIYGELRRKEALVEDPDLLIASICIAKGFPLVTGNSKHYERFEKYGLRIQPLADFMKAAQSG